MTRHAYSILFAVAIVGGLGASSAQAQCSGGAGAQSGLSSVSCTGVAAWSGSSSYAAGANVVYNNCLYRANQAISANSAWCPGCSGVYLYGNGSACPAAGCNYGAQGVCGGGATPTSTATRTATPTGSGPTATATRTPTATATSGGGTIANGAYRIINKNSGKCVDAAAAGTANGTVVQQYACNGSNAQVWQFVSAGGGYYKILTQNNTAQGIDVTGGTSATADGVKLQLWANGGASNQLFLAVSEGGGYYHLSAQNSGKCIDVPGASVADAVQLQQWTCNGSAAQSFQVTNTTAATPTATSPGPTPTQSSGGTGNFPARFSAPYVATWNNPNLASLASSTGNKFWTLAFIINGGGTCNPMWNGDTALSTTFNISGLKAAGGDAIVSFGGASGVEIAGSCGDVASLQAAYQRVINAMGSKILDFDIESGQESNTTTVDRRNKAIRGLQQANAGLKIDYTLAVDRSGLPSAQINLLNNAKANGVAINAVNIMAMDYGPCYGDMGQAGVDAANATKNQLAANGISAHVGITPMIGVNDVSCENFTTSDANVVVNFAQGNSFVNLLAYWVQDADPNHSYINIFKTFH